MDAKKAPGAWRRWGRNETGGNGAACFHSAPDDAGTQAKSRRTDDTCRPRQSLVCRACAHGIVPTLRAALRGLAGCTAGHIVDGAAWPGLCPDFRAVRTPRGDAHAA